MSKHTPGPWEIEYSNLGSDSNGRRFMGIIRSTYGVIARVFGFENPDDETVPNARLIAAAPELLEDSNKLATEIFGVMGTFGLRELIGNTNFAVLRERYMKMRQTIQKAEGEE